MADPIRELMDEHRNIEKVLAALRFAAPKELPLAFYVAAVDFIAEYADGLHHAKEEDRLFPLFEKRGVPRDGGPIGVMLAEHVDGRQYVADMRAALEAEDRGELRRASLAYAALLEGHIMKEDQVLYPMGQSLLAPGDVEALRASFDEVDTHGAKAARYAAIADELLAQAEGEA